MSFYDTPSRSRRVKPSWDESHHVLGYVDKSGQGRPLKARKYFDPTIAGECMLGDHYQNKDRKRFSSLRRGSESPRTKQIRAEDKSHRWDEKWAIKAAIGDTDNKNLNIYCRHYFEGDGIMSGYRARGLQAPHATMPKRCLRGLDNRSEVFVDLASELKEIKAEEDRIQQIKLERRPESRSGSTMGRSRRGSSVGLTKSRRHSDASISQLPAVMTYTRKDSNLYNDAKNKLREQQSRMSAASSATDSTRAVSSCADSSAVDSKNSSATDANPQDQEGGNTISDEVFPSAEKSKTSNALDDRKGSIMSASTAVGSPTETEAASMPSPTDTANPQDGAAVQNNELAATRKVSLATTTGTRSRPTTRASPQRSIRSQSMATTSSEFRTPSKKRAKSQMWDDDWWKPDSRMNEVGSYRKNVYNRAYFSKSPASIFFPDAEERAERQRSQSLRTLPPRKLTQGDIYHQTLKERSMQVNNGALKEASSSTRLSSTEDLSVARSQRSQSMPALTHSPGSKIEEEWGTDSWYVYGKLSGDNPKLNSRCRHYFSNPGIGASSRVRSLSVRDQRKPCTPRGTFNNYDMKQQVNPRFESDYDMKKGRGWNDRFQLLATRTNKMMSMYVREYFDKPGRYLRYKHKMETGNDF